ncbi:MAG: DUF2809 domain-containing protein [Verrucomicrobiota bacterium]
MHPSVLPPHRNRLLYAGAVVLVLGLGLLWRSKLLPLPVAITKYGGDALWALMVFLGIGFIRPMSPTLQVGLTALGFAWVIEFLQLYHAPWIDGLRATLPGRLILGSTFNAPDLLAYAVGIGVGMWAERACFRKRPATH